MEKIRVSEEVGIKFMNRWEEEMEWRKEGREETLAELVRDGILKIDEAAKRADMTVEEFQALLDHQEETPNE